MGIVDTGNKNRILFRSRIQHIVVYHVRNPYIVLFCMPIWCHQQHILFKCYHKKSKVTD